MARTFKDCNGREWIVKATVDKIEKIRVLNGVDLADVTAEAMRRLRVDDVLLVRVIWNLCEAEADGAGISAEQFGESLFGDAIESAFEAVKEAVSDFFPSRKRKMWEKFVREDEAEQQKALEMAVAELENPENQEAVKEAMRTRIKDEIQSALTRLRSVTGLPDSVDSTPAPGPSAN